MITEVGDGHHVAVAATFGELLDRWYDHAAPNWSPATRLEHRRQIDVRLKPLLGDRQLRKLTASDLDAFYAHQRKKGGRGGKPLGAATVRRTHVVVHAALAQAVKWRWLAVNPASTASGL